MSERDTESLDILEEELELKIRNAVKPYEGMPMALSGGIDSSLLAVFIEPEFAVTVELPGDVHNELNWAKVVASHLNLKHHIIQLDHDRFESSVESAVKAIGRPIPHFNVFPLYEMYRQLSEVGVKDFVLGDGPDETMCGYARDLIIAHVYGLYDMSAFKHYKPLLDKMIMKPAEAISRATGKSVDEIEALGAKSAVEMALLTDMLLMREDMDSMSNGIAASFGITNHRPYQDNEALDKYMFELPMEAKVKEVEYGKYLLRKIASKYLPYGVAWRKGKVGGPVYPVNRMMGWMDKGEFDKTAWMEYQAKLLAR